MVSGPVLLKMKATCWIVILLGSKKMKNKTEQLNEIGQMLVPGALNDTKKIRKASADIFANFGAEKPWIYPKRGRMQPRRATLHGAPGRALLFKSLTTRNMKRPTWAQHGPRHGIEKSSLSLLRRHGSAQGHSKVPKRHPEIPK